MLICHLLDVGEYLGFTKYPTTLAENNVCSSPPPTVKSKYSTLLHNVVIDPLKSSLLDVSFERHDLLIDHILVYYHAATSHAPRSQDFFRAERTKTNIERQSLIFLSVPFRMVRNTDPDLNGNLQSDTRTSFKIRNENTRCNSLQVLFVAVTCSRHMHWCVLGSLCNQVECPWKWPQHST